MNSLPVYSVYVSTCRVAAEGEGDILIIALANVRTKMTGMSADWNFGVMFHVEVFLDCGGSMDLRNAGILP
jgi:hypothetical protein